MPKPVRCFATAALAILLVLSASGETLVLEEGVSGYEGTADASLYEDRPDNSNGGHPYIYVGRTQGASLRRGLIRFDLGTTIPAGSLIESVSLRLVVDRSRPGSEPHTLHRVLRPWGEGDVNSADPGGLGAPAEPGDATWRSAIHGTDLWSSGGGDASLTTSSETMVDVQGSTAIFTGTALVDDVQAWLNAPSSNHGWLLRGDETGIQNARRFISREGTSGLRPRLTIQYSAPSAVTEWMSYQ